MSRYSESKHPHHAVRQFRGQPGNYILHFSDGTAYVGRQGAHVSRLDAHMRTHGEQVVGVQFMTDHENNHCVRAEREQRTVKQLERAGVMLRNLIEPSRPQSCPPRRKR